jgi:hypothetical protein
LHAETHIAYRTKDDPVAGGAGRSHDGKLLVVGAVECKDGGRPGRIRLSVIPDYSAKTLKGFVASSTGDGSTILTDAFSYASERHRLAGSGARRRTLWLARG